MNALFRRGLKGPLEDEDLYQHCNDLDSERCTDTFSKLWDEERKRGKPSVLRMIMAAHGKTFLPLGILYSMCESLSKWVLFYHIFEQRAIITFYFTYYFGIQMLTAALFGRFRWVFC